MPRPSREVGRLADAYRLALHDVSGGTAGARLGRGTGSSLEFQDRRAYAAGDDVRHLDWRTFARTGELQVKLYREEIAPRVEVLVDDSRSMRTDPAKAQLALDLAQLLAELGRAEGFGVTLLRLGDDAGVVPLERYEAEGLELDSRTPLVESLRRVRPLLRAGALRFVVSDFLEPASAEELVRPLAARAGGLALLQVLSEEDAAPRVGSALRLTDAESGGTLDLVLDARSVATYLERLRALGAALSEECRRSRGLFATLVATRTLEEHCRASLVPLGLLEGAAG